MNPPELEKPRVTEILVRMDCNGCVQKIKKALHGINGIYDMYIDFPQQKLTIIGWADPEKIVKAIRKSRKTATICSHSDPTNQQAQPTEAPPEGAQPPTETANPPSTEGSPAETTPPTEPPKDPPPPENPTPDVVPPATEGAPPASQTGQAGNPKDVEEVHVIYHPPPTTGYRYSYVPSFYGYGGQGSSVINAPNVQTSNYSAGPEIRQQTPSPIYVAHSYSTYKPSSNVTEHVPLLPPYQPNKPEAPQSPHHVHHSGPELPQNDSRTEPLQHTNYSRPEPPPPQVIYSRHEQPQYSYYSRPEPQRYYYSRPDQYYEDYRNNNNGNITSVFSDENPNACTIV